MDRVFLFDIDLTMIRTNRAGGLAMTDVLHEMTGIDDAFAGVEFGGRTDVSLLREALVRHERADRDFDAFVARFKELYLPRLRDYLQERGGVVLPGVPALVDAIAALPRARLGLATGNFRGAAEIKLRHFDLWGWFPDGGFAEDGEERAALVAAAMRRVTGSDGARQVVVFGDSTYDIAAAKANGATAVGVATGGSSAAMLTAAGADLVFDDLADTDTVLRMLLDEQA